MIQWATGAIPLALSNAMRPACWWCFVMLVHCTGKEALLDAVCPPDFILCIALCCSEVLNCDGVLVGTEGAQGAAARQQLSRQLCQPAQDTHSNTDAVACMPFDTVHGLPYVHADSQRHAFMCTCAPDDARPATTPHISWDSLTSRVPVLRRNQPMNAPRCSLVGVNC